MTTGRINQVSIFRSLLRPAAFLTHSLGDERLRVSGCRAAKKRRTLAGRALRLLLFKGTYSNRTGFLVVLHQQRVMRPTEVRWTHSRPEPLSYPPLPSRASVCLGFLFPSRSCLDSDARGRSIPEKNLLNTLPNSATA